VAKLSQDGSALLFSTFLGGEDVEWGNGIAVDTLGNVYVAGETQSDFFPTTPGAFDETYSGLPDGFVTKLNAAGSALIYSTFLGASENEAVGDLAINSNGNVFVTGVTNSPQFPTTPGVFDTSYNGNFDVFVSNLSPAGDALLYSTFLGGTGNEGGGSIAVNEAGWVWIGGGTDSTDFQSQVAFTTQRTTAPRISSWPGWIALAAI
jgi:hypothetical protein